MKKIITSMMMRKDLSLNSTEKGFVGVGCFALAFYFLIKIAFVFGGLYLLYLAILFLQSKIVG